MQIVTIDYAKTAYLIKIPAKYANPAVVFVKPQKLLIYTHYVATDSAKTVKTLKKKT